MNWETNIEQADALNYSTRISDRYEPISQQVVAALNELAGEIIQHIGLKHKTGAYRDRYYKSVSAIVLSADDANAWGKYVRLSLNESRYTPPKPKYSGRGRPKSKKTNRANLKHFTVYHRLSYEAIRRSLYALAELGYIELHKGYYQRSDGEFTVGGSGKETRYCATQQLLNLLHEQHEVERHMYVELPGQNLIRLLGSDKEPLDFEPTKLTKCWELMLQRYNDALAQTHIALNLNNDGYRLIENRARKKSRDQPWLKIYYNQALNLHKKAVFRVFSRGDTKLGKLFKLGGRLFGGWWMVVPSNCRKLIMIAGQKTIEVDFSCLHVYLLYALAGIQYSGDAYALEDLTTKDRGNLKLAFQAMINIKEEHRDDEVAARKSAAALIKKYFTKRKPIADGNAPVGSLAAFKAAVENKPKSVLPDSYSKLEDVFTAFEEMHPEIADRFFKPDTGLILQNLESEIVMRAIQDLLDQGVVALSVHDSLIAQEQYKNKLIESMVKNYKLVMKGFAPQLKYDQEWEKQLVDNLAMPASDDVTSVYLDDVTNTVTYDEDYSRHLQYKKDYFAQRLLMSNPDPTDDD